MASKLEESVEKVIRLADSHWALNEDIRDSLRQVAREAMRVEYIKGVLNQIAYCKDFDATKYGNSSEYLQDIAKKAIKT